MEDSAAAAAAATATASPAAGEETASPRPSRQARKRRANKKRKNGGKSTPQPAPLDEAAKRQKTADTQSSVLEYLRLWSTDRASWKFAKLKQRVSECVLFPQGLHWGLPAPVSPFRPPPAAWPHTVDERAPRSDPVGHGLRSVRTPKGGLQDVAEIPRRAARTGAGGHPCNGKEVC